MQLNTKILAPHRPNARKSQFFCIFHFLNEYDKENRTQKAVFQALNNCRIQLFFDGVQN